MPKRISTVRGREFGDAIRAVIAGTGSTAGEVAEIVGWDKGKLSDLVCGKGGVTQVELAFLLGACRVEQAEVAHLMALFPMQEHRGWWQRHGVCQPLRLRTAVENLSQATTLVSWNPHMVPVLLQTPDYAREVLQASATLPNDEIEDRVQARLTMQRVLPPNVKRAYFLHEMALRILVGGAEVHAQQMQRITAAANRPHTTVRIVPAARGAHAGTAGPFTQLTFAKYEPLVWVDTENSSLFDEAKDALTGYEKVIRALEDTSLTEDESNALISQLGQDTQARGAQSAQTRGPSTRARGALASSTTPA
ncbi:DUF5753 domain-containing protein [Lentzea flaviverrucosa]|uniref:DUF5753 domain-containing protein n=1 Tax=Lentzea flaviverrucosa TaxID=200379 RepID=A0A1H9EWT2_9PSEU|nr:DUF5753 domain-containing protein [Lentzea flaviverrucosa]RDI35375.1 hypothetical protein DFR72_1011126 [Lentzea flaviverrucosa]SEQ30047.1 hypothetical protein SAMN05216195_10291 [Lentzea flaviverrucosa]